MSGITRFCYPKEGILIQFSELFSSTKGREFDNKIGKYSNAAPMSVPPSLSTHWYLYKQAAEAPRDLFEETK